MKAFKRFFCILMMSGLVFLIAACDMDFSAKTITKIELSEGTLPTESLVGEFNVTDGVLLITYSDGTMETIEITTSMLSPVELSKTTTPGTHILKINYKGYTFDYVISLIESDAASINDKINTAMAGLAIISTTKDNFTLPLTYGGVNVSWESSSPAIKVEDGQAMISRPSVDSTDSIVVLTATFNYFGVSKTKDYQVTVEKYSEVDYREIVDKIENSIVVADKIQTTLSLPFGSSNYPDCEILWTSSNPSIIAIDNTLKSVTVTGVSSQVDVTLSYKIKYLGYEYLGKSSHVVTVYPENTAVKAPNVTNLKITNTTLSFTAASGISSYLIYVNSTPVTTISTTALNLTSIIKKAGSYTIGVQSIASGIYNVNSDIISVTYSAVDVEGYNGTYYNSINLELTGTALKTKLRELLTSTHKSVRTYDNLKTDIPKTDKSLTDSSVVLLIYSRVTTKAKWNSGGLNWNREHVWPQSLGWFSTSGAGADLHHLRPEDATLNSTRGNKPFGEVNGGKQAYLSSINGSVPSNCYYSSSYFEPQDEAKGDVARILFYMFTRYPQSDSYSFTRVAQSLDMLILWSELDPVDEWEMQRNNVTQSIQGNRNPFIDYPELAKSIWK